MTNVTKSREIDPNKLQENVKNDIFRRMGLNVQNNILLIEKILGSNVRDYVFKSMDDLEQAMNKRVVYLMSQFVYNIYERKKYREG